MNVSVCLFCGSLYSSQLNFGCMHLYLKRNFVRDVPIWCGHNFKIYYDNMNILYGHCHSLLVFVDLLRKYWRILNIPWTSTTKSRIRGRRRRRRNRNNGTERNEKEIENIFFPLIWTSRSNQVISVCPSKFVDKIAFVFAIFISMSAYMKTKTKLYIYVCVCVERHQRNRITEVIIHQHWNMSNEHPLDNSVIGQMWLTEKKKKKTFIATKWIKWENYYSTFRLNSNFRQEWISKTASLANVQCNVQREWKYT